MNKHMVFIALLLSGFLLSGCSAWKEDFEQKPVRGYPKASIHEISMMVNRGEIKEDDAGSVTTIGLNSDNAGGSATSFYDSEISRGNFPMDTKKYKEFTSHHMKMKTKYFTKHTTYMSL